MIRPADGAEDEVAPEGEPEKAPTTTTVTNATSGIEDEEAPCS